MLKHQEKLYKAVGGIIAILFIISAVIITFALIEFGLSAQQKQAELQRQAYTIQAKSASIAKALEGTWLYNSSAGILIINITNYYTEPVKIVGIVVFFENGEVEVINETYTALNGIFTFPKTLLPGKSVSIEITAPSKPKTVTFSATTVEEATVVAIAAKPYTPTIANITLAAPTITVQNLPTTRVYGEGTVTWQGTAEIATPKTITADIVAATVNNVSITNYDALEQVDGNRLRVPSIIGGIITLKQNNTLYYEDFSTNPIGTTFTTNTDTWLWSTTYGYENGGIYQSSPLDGPSTSGYEILGYFNDILIPSQKVYIAAKIKHDSSGSNAYADILLYTSDSQFYELSTVDDSDTLEIWLYNGFWYPLRSTSGNIPSDTWLAYYVEYVPSSGFMRLSVYDLSTGDYIGSVSAIDTTISPTRIGLGTWRENAYFDDVLMSFGDPRFVNVTGVPAGFTVELWSGSDLVASGVSSGATVPVVLDVSTNYVVRDARFVIRDASGSPIPVYPSSFDLVLGGNVYEFSPKYVADVKVTTRTSVSNATELYICAFFNSNVSIDSSILIYNFDKLSFENKASFSSVSSVSQCIPVTGNANSYINSTGNSIIEVYFSSSSPFEVYIDMLNLNITYLLMDTRDVLIVGVGGTSLIEMYYLSLINGSVVFSKAPFTIDAHTIFNGSATLTYLPYSDALDKLVLVNSTGIYTTYLEPDASWTLLTSSAKVFGVGVQAEVVGDYLVIVNGSNANTYVVCVGSSCSSSKTLPRGLVVGEYSASASNGTHMFLLTFNESSYEALIVAYDPSADAFTGEIGVPGSDSVGLCYGGGYLWLMLKGGSLYKVDFNTQSVANTNIVLPSYPISYGDRLEYYSNKLLFVRDDNTNEILIIPLG